MAGKAVKEVSIGQDGFHIEVDIKGNHRKQCVGNCGTRGKWRFCTRNFVCAACRQRRPHKLVSRSTAKAAYDVTFEDLHHAHQTGLIQMMTMHNPHGRGQPPMRLYYDHEVAILAEALHRTRVPGENGAGRSGAR